MRILMIAPEPFFEPRGTPISVYQRLSALSTLKHEVDLLTYHIGKDVDFPCVQIHRVPRIPLVKQIKIGPSWSKLLLDSFLFLKAIHMLATKRYDVIHSHEEAAFFSIFLAGIFRTIHLYDMHSSLPKQLKHSKYGRLKFAVALFKWLEKRVIRGSNAIITIGADLEADVKRINPQVPHLMIENIAIHAGRLNADPGVVEQVKTNIGLNGNKLVVYTGSFEPYQGLDLLLESALIVRKSLPSVLYLLVGGNPEQIREYQEKVRQMNLQATVQFTGLVSPEQALAYLEIADVLVSPRVEGMSVPLKIYTYLFSGKLCVATRMPAHTQVLNEEIALLVEPTTEAFAGGVLEGLQNPDYSERIGMQAQQFALEKYNFSNYLAKVNQIYQHLKRSEFGVEQSIPVLEE